MKKWTPWAERSRQAGLQRANACTECSARVTFIQGSAKSPVHLAPEYFCCISCFLCFHFFIILILNVNASVTDLNGAFGNICNQQQSVLIQVNIRLPVRDDSVFYRTGGNPIHTAEKQIHTDFPV